jgi:hypothetical protein
VRGFRSCSSPPRSSRCKYSRRAAVCAPALVSRFSGPESGTCFAGVHSPWPSFAPPAPRRLAPPCSPASQLLRRSPTSAPVHHRLQLLAFPMRTRAQVCPWSDAGSTSFQRSPFARDVFFDPGRAVVPRIAALIILRSTITTASAPAMRQFRGSIDTPCNCCVRFVTVVTAGSRNTHYRATRYGLTRAGLSPAGLRQPYWRLRL